MIIYVGLHWILEPDESCGLATMSQCYNTLPLHGSNPSSLFEVRILSIGIIWILYDFRKIEFSYHHYGVMFSKDVRGIESAHVCQWYCREIYRNKCNWFLYDKKTKDCKLFEGSLMELFDDCRENSYAIDPDFEQCQAVYSSDSEYACEVVLLIHFIGIT